MKISVLNQHRFLEAHCYVVPCQMLTHDSCFTLEKSSKQKTGYRLFPSGPAPPGLPWLTVLLPAVGQQSFTSYTSKGRRHQTESGRHVRCVLSPHPPLPEIKHNPRGGGGGGYPMDTVGAVLQHCPSLAHKQKLQRK